MMKSVTFALLMLVLVPPPAFAHWGHVGELAGHAHWIAAGAIAVAAALAAALNGIKDEAETEETVDDNETVEEGSAA